MQSKDIDAELDLAQEINDQFNDPEKCAGESLDAMQNHFVDDNADDYDDGDWNSSSSHRASPIGEEEQEIKATLASVQAKDKQLAGVKAETIRLIDDLVDKGEFHLNDGDDLDAIDVDADRKRYASLINDLKNKIHSLESENQRIKSQIEAQDDLGLAKVKDLDIDQDLLDYVSRHNKELSLDFLKKAHETFLEMRAKNSNFNFNQYIEEIKQARKNYHAELSQILVSKKEVELKLQKMKQRYEEELSTFNELRIEHLFKNSGAQQYLDGIKEKNRLNTEQIETMKKELTSKRRELEMWREKHEKIEAERTKYYEAWKMMQLKKEQLEAERKAFMKINMSSASSMVDNGGVPPIPHLTETPTVEELLRQV